MKPIARHYDHAADYERVGEFLVLTFGAEGGHVNWLQPRWEYMHHHPFVRKVDLGSIGVWEANDEIVGVVHPEHGMGTAYFQIGPAFASLTGNMLTHAEAHLSALRDGVRRLGIYINDDDDEFQRLAAARGYAKADEAEPMSRFDIPRPFPPITLPTGFGLKSLADDNDLRKVHRLLWRGFGHGQEPPDDGVEDRKLMQSAPNYRHDLNIVVEAPDGHFVSYCGMWLEPVHGVAYVEPVATDPDYRRMGLGRAAVLEGIRRCGEAGATAAYVGTAKPFYLSFGFHPIYNRSLWQREWI